MSSWSQLSCQLLVSITVIHFTSLNPLLRWTLEPKFYIPPENIFNIFTPDVWLLILGSMLAVATFFIVSSLVGKAIGTDMESSSVVLFPLR